MLGRFASFSTVGGVCAATGAGLCCVGPLVLVAVGAGGSAATAATILEPYRPLLSVVALVLLGWAGWRLYRPAARPLRLWRGAYWAAVVASLLLIAAPYWVPLLG